MIFLSFMYCRMSIVVCPAGCPTLGPNPWKVCSAAPGLSGNKTNDNSQATLAASKQFLQRHIFVCFHPCQLLFYVHDKRIFYTKTEKEVE